MFQIEVKELRKKLSKLDGDSFITIKENQIILPVHKESYQIPTFEEFSKEVNNFANIAHETYTRKEKEKAEEKGIFGGLL